MRVLYRVEGTATAAAVVYTAEGGGDEMAGVIPPWSREVDAGPGAVVSLAARRKMGATGTLGRRILVGGRDAAPPGESGPAGDRASLSARLPPG